MVIGEFDEELKERHLKDLEDIVEDQGESWAQFEDGTI